MPILRDRTKIETAGFNRGRKGLAMLLVHFAFPLWAAVMPPPQTTEETAGYAELATLSPSSAAELAREETFYRRLLAKQQSALPPDDPATAVVLHDLGVVLRIRGDSRAALKLFEQARDTFASSPRTRWRYARALVEIANCDWALKKPYDAEPLLRQAISIFSSLDPPDTVGTAVALNTLGSLYLELSDPEGGERQFYRALALAQSNPSVGATTEAVIRGNLAAAFFADGHARHALTLYQESVADLERDLGPASPTLGQMLLSYAEVLRKLHHKAEARQVQREAHSILASITAH
jgi:tetratricopeptide (TPR) repeat protein